MNRQLPEGWREVRLGDISESAMYGLNAKAVKFDGKNKYIRITDIDDRTHKFAPNPLTSPARGIEKKYKLVENDLLFARTGASVGKTYLYDKNDGDIYFAGYLIKFNIPNENAKFVFSQTLLKTYDDWVTSMSTRSGQPGINMEEFKKLSLILPPHPEQKAIASLLETWDEAIEKTETLIVAKEKRFKWLLKRLIGGQQDNPKWRKAKLGEVFGDQLKIEKGKMLTKAEANKGVFPVVAGGQTYATFHNECTHSTKTITISGSGAYAGFIWFHDYPIFATDCNVITSISGVIEYFYYMIKMQQKRLYSLQSGGAQPHIYAKDIAVLDTVIPDLSEQKRIARILTTAQREIDILKQLANCYHTQKRGLMRKLLTGQWRMKI